MKYLKHLGLRLRDAGRDQRGNVLILFAASMTMMVGLAAVSVDVGRAYATRQRLKMVLDGAAFAGASRLPDTNAASAAANQVLQANKVPSTQASITFSPDNTWIYVNAQDTVKTTFARVLGVTQVSVPGNTAAHSAPAKQVTGVIPIGVPNQTFTYGQKVVLKGGSGNSVGPGNYGALALGGNGANTYRDNLASGYQSPLRVGDRVPTKPGNMVGPTEQGCNARMAQQSQNNSDENYDDNHQFEGEEWGQNGAFVHSSPGSPLVAFLPVVDFSGVQGRSDVEVLGFAAFHIEGCTGGEVTGRFLRAVTETDFAAGGQDFGLHAVKLGY